MVKYRKGKKGFRQKTNILKYKDYRIIEKIALPGFPLGYASGVNLSQMFLNDKLGDCACACTLHLREVFTSMGGIAKLFTDTDAENLYEGGCDYNPKDPSTDQGCEFSTLLQYLKNQGIISSFLQLDNTNINEFYEVVYYFGGPFIGVQLPQSAEDQFNNGEAWDVVANDGGILGGHAIGGVEASAKTTTLKIVGVTAKGDLIVSTWGGLIPMTPAFFNKYVDEGWLAFDKEILNAQGVTPAGFNFAQLEADEQAITGQTPQPVSNTLPTYLAVDPVTAAPGAQIQLTADLIETDNNEYIGGENVIFSISGKEIGAVATNKNGKATLNYTISQKAGTYPIGVTFAGDATYAPTVGNNTLTVTGTTPNQGVVELLEEAIKFLGNPSYANIQKAEGLIKEVINSL